MPGLQFRQHARDRDKELTYLEGGPHAAGSMESGKPDVHAAGGSPARLMDGYTKLESHYVYRRKSIRGNILARAHGFEALV